MQVREITKVSPWNEQQQGYRVVMKCGHNKYVDGVGPALQAPQIGFSTMCNMCAEAKEAESIAEFIDETLDNSLGAPAPSIPTIPDKTDPMWLWHLGLLDTKPT